MRLAAGIFVLAWATVTIGDAQELPCRFSISTTTSYKKFISVTKEIKNPITTAGSSHRIPSSLAGIHADTGGYSSTTGTVFNNNSTL